MDRAEASLSLPGHRRGGSMDINACLLLAAACREVLQLSCEVDVYKIRRDSHSFQKENVPGDF